MTHLEVRPSPPTPDGKWLLVRDYVFAPESDSDDDETLPGSPSEIYDMSAPDAPAREDWPQKLFRMRASTECTHDLLLSSAKAVKRIRR